MAQKMNAIQTDTRHNDTCAPLLQLVKIQIQINTRNLPIKNAFREHVDLPQLVMRAEGWSEGNWSTQLALG